MDTPMWMVLQSGLPGPHDEEPAAAANAGVGVVVAVDVVVAKAAQHMARRRSAT